MNVYWYWLAVLLLLLCGSCTPLPATTDQPQESITQMPSAPPTGDQISPINTLDSSEVPAPPANANPFVRLVEEDLAARLNITIEEINFLKITDIDWQDITQGCTTASSQTTTKGRVSGYRIWLEANGVQYLYHIGLDNRIVFCTQ